MASIPLTGEKVTIFQDDVDFNSPNSEAVQTKIAKAALFAQNVSEYTESLNYNGYFRSNSFSDEAERFVVTKRSSIVRYIMHLGNSGSSTANALNAKIYDNTGAFVNNLFSTAPSILSPSNRVNSYIGRNVAEATTISGNLSGATTNFGTLNVTTLEEGWVIVGNIVSNAGTARDASLDLILQRLE
jgi:hypothetical protein